MNYVPPRRPIVVFDRSYRGSVGSFQTDTSFSIQYLQSSLKISDLGQLSTAAELLDFDATHFDELIQRDIDKLRVQRIAKNYLRGGQNRPVFFPPLIVCVGLLDPTTGLLRQQYELVERNRANDGGQDMLVSTFDRDGFQVKLPIAEEGQSERRMQWDGQAVPYYEFAAELALNSRRTRLIVLDGQHRLEALRSLQHTAEDRRVTEHIELPVCIIWSPAANIGQAENIVTDYRELFVTINSEPQRVSGHFLILLDDLKNNSLAVRELADAWKHERAGGWSRLHLLEWNTRENERTDQRTRASSITTISIIAKVLKDYFFEIRGLPSKALALPTRTVDFEAIDTEFQPEELVDIRPPPALSKIVGEQIRAQLVPALNVLLRQLRPYAQQEAKISQAFARLQEFVESPNPAYISLDQQLRRFNYVIDDPVGGEVIGAYANFRQWARNAEGDEVYFLAVFQQALLRMWLRLLTVLDPISATQAATAVVAALNTFAVREAADVQNAYLGLDLPYCRRVLWKGEKVNYSSEWARSAWTNILMATLLRPDVHAAALAAVSDDPEVRAALGPTLTDEGLRSARYYASRLSEEIRRDTYNNLSDYFGEAEALQMRELKRVDEAEFEAKILANAQPRYLAALTQMANRLQRRTEDLAPAV